MVAGYLFRIGLIMACNLHLYVTCGDTCVPGNNNVFCRHIFNRSKYMS